MPSNFKKDQSDIMHFFPCFNFKMRWSSRFNSVAKFSPTKLNQTKFLTNKEINSYLFTESEGALVVRFLTTKRNLLLILEISHQPVGENWELPYYLTWSIFPDVTIRHIGTELDVIRVHSISEINAIKSLNE